MIHTPLRPTHVERFDCDCYAYQPVATKFMSPVSTQHTIQTRSRLLALLRRGLSYPLVLVSAATGSGKTTLLSQWTHTLENEHVSVAWVSLDANDNDPLCFWHVLQMAIAQQLPAFDASQRSTMTENASAILSCFINACVAQRQQMVLILDDFHTITNTTIHKQMAYLIEHLPPHLHIVLSTQVDPSLPLARLRGRDQLVEIRGNDLCFTYEEAAMFLRETMQLSLKAAEIIYLINHVDGWITGLYLAGHALCEQHTTKSVPDAVQGSQRYLLDYIVDEVLLQQEDDIQTFLLRTAHLSHFSASLCDAMLGQQNSQQIIQHLACANLFLVAEDDEHEWYHYQPFFAEALRTHLERTESEVVSMLHRRASLWYEQHGLLFDAIEHLCEVCDWEHADQLIERIMRQQSGKNPEQPSLTVLQSLLARLPGVLVQMPSHHQDFHTNPEPEKRHTHIDVSHQEQKEQKAVQPRQTLPSQPLLDPISLREMEVLQLIAQGASNIGIANNLVIAPATVKRHVSSILSKLQATNRTQAVACARQFGLLH